MEEWHQLVLHLQDCMQGVTMVMEEEEQTVLLIGKPWDALEEKIKATPTKISKKFGPKNICVLREKRWLVLMFCFHLVSLFLLF